MVPRIRQGSSASSPEIRDNERTIPCTRHKVSWACHRQVAYIDSRPSSPCHESPSRRVCLGRRCASQSQRVQKCRHLPCFLSLYFHFALYFGFVLLHSETENSAWSFCGESVHGSTSFKITRRGKSGVGCAQFCLTSKRRWSVRTAAPGVRRLNAARQGAGRIVMKGHKSTSVVKSIHTCRVSYVVHGVRSFLLCKSADPSLLERHTLQTLGQRVPVEGNAFRKLVFLPGKSLDCLCHQSVFPIMKHNTKFVPHAGRTDQRRKVAIQSGGSPSSNEHPSV